MTITALPSLDRTSPSFKTGVDTFFGTQLPAFVSEANALQADVNAKQATASSAATTATTAASTATTQAALATTNGQAQVTLAANQVTLATTQATNAAASAASALNAPGTSATSTTSVAVGAGSKTVTIQTGKAFSVGQFVVVASTASPANYMVGQITAYTSGTGNLTVNVTSVGGSGTFAAWTVSMTALRADMAVSLAGNLSPCVTQAVTLTITNFDSATTYGVSATGGSASLSGDTITYVAGATTGSYAITITAGSASRVVTVTVLAAAVVAPGITSPASGATNIGQTPTITTGAFSVVGASDTHLNSDWEIRTAANGGGTLIASSYADTTNKVSWAVPGGLLAVSTTYYARARHRGTTLGAGAWSEASFTTAAAFAPTVPGTAYAGGFYAGRVVIGGSTYAIIVAPKASGHSTSKQWKTTNDTTSGTLSLNDGLTNSNAMNNASHPAAQFCRGLSVGGYTDWYLPSRDELEVCYRALKPTTDANGVYASRMTNWGVGAGVYNGVDAQGNGDNDNSSPAGAAYTAGDPAQTAATAFRSGGAECFDSAHYWTSTEFDAPNAWVQTFSTGSQSYYSKTNDGSVRAVRKVLI